MSTNQFAVNFNYKFIINDIDLIDVVEENKGNYIFTIHGYSPLNEKINEQLTSLIDVKGPIYISDFDLPLYGFIFCINYNHVSNDTLIIEIKFKASLHYLKETKEHLNKVEVNNVLESKEDIPLTKRENQTMKRKLSF